MAADTAPASIQALIGLLLLHGFAIALVLWKAQGDSTAYLASGIAFIVSLVLAAFAERRFHLSRHDPKLVSGEITVIVALVLIVTSLDAPILETVLLGTVAGLLFGTGLMMYLETVRGSKER